MIVAARSAVIVAIAGEQLASADAVLNSFELVERSVGALGFVAKVELARIGLLGHGLEVAYLVERKPVRFGKT